MVEMRAMRGLFVGTWVAAAVVAAVPAMAAANTPLGDPSSNIPLPDATFDTCAQAPNGAACLAAVTADIDNARALEGVGPISLPTDWTALSVPLQLLVIANLERV